MARWVLGLLLACASPSAGGETYFKWREEDQTRHFLILQYRHWFTSGGTTFRNSQQIPLDQIAPRGIVAYLGATQDFHSSPGMEIFSAELRPFKRVFFGLEFGTTLVGNGKGTTEDWVHAPGSRLKYIPTGFTFVDPHHADYFAFTESLDGRTTLFTANVYVNLVDGRVGSFDDHYEHSLDLLFGYTRFAESYHQTNLNVTFSPGTVIQGVPVGPIPGLNSSYAAVWQGPHVGIRETLEGPYGIFIYGNGNFSPLSFYTGRGFDNFSAQQGTLRTDAPNFTHSADGMSVEMNVSLGWKPYEIWRLAAGYGFYYYFSRQGTERQYLPGGSTTDITLDYARTLRSGIFLSSSLFF